MNVETAAPPPWITPALWRALISRRDAARAGGASETAALAAAAVHAAAARLAPQELESVMQALAATRASTLHRAPLDLGQAEPVLPPQGRRARPRRGQAARPLARWLARARGLLLGHARLA